MKRIYIYKALIPLKKLSEYKSNNNYLHILELYRNHRKIHVTELSKSSTTFPIMTICALTYQKKLSKHNVAKLNYNFSLQAITR